VADSINIPRNHLIMVLCLPLAVLVGYFLAMPLESGSIAVIALVLSGLCVPLLMKWHHPMLILSWNVCANPLFLPGRPSLWVLMGLISLFFAVLARSLNTKRHFIQVPSITRPILFLAAVVIATAMVTGGIGIRSVGSDRYGGKGYFYILAAIGGYFALTSQRIPAHKSGLYVAMFFLSGLTSLIGDLAFSAGPHFYFLTTIFAPDLDIQKMASTFTVTPEMVRLGALPVAGAAIYAWLLARHGVRGVLSFRRPWRPFLVLVAVAFCLISGFRSSVILLALTFGCVFYFEGLCRTHLLPIVAGIGLLTGIVLLPQADQLPLLAQRALSFLPAVPVNEIAKQGAQASTQWRVEMWKEVLPQIPKYLFKGKGYTIDPNDLFLAQISTHHGFGIQAAGALIAGDYHNGPLSVIIPFGLFGLIGFIWLIVAGLRVLYHHHRFGDPALQRVNTFLLAAFLAKTLLFLLVFGGLSSELYVFTGLLGLSVSLNGPPRAGLESETTPATLTVIPERAV
jgi:hypothetical protein